jgi:predicted DNA-binding protein YlxM (UPF0122 family)
MWTTKKDIHIFKIIINYTKTPKYLCGKIHHAMKQKQQARQMFFQSDMTRTEIADKLGVSRRTIYQWSVDGNWDKLRQSARNMPVMLAEKVYYLIGHLTDQMLQKDPLSPIVTKEEVDMLGKLTSIVCRLRKGSTVSENMETFTYLLERISSKDPELAQQVSPHLNDYIEARRGKTEKDFLLSGFNENATLPYPEQEIREKWLDEEEQEKMREEREATPKAPVTNKETATTQASNNPTPHKPPVTNTATTANTPKPAPKSIFSHYRTPEKKQARELVVA